MLSGKELISIAIKAFLFMVVSFMVFTFIGENIHHWFEFIRIP